MSSLENNVDEHEFDFIHIYQQNIDDWKPAHCFQLKIV